MKNSYARIALWWLPMPLIGIANGTLRIYLLNTIAPDLVAHQISAFLLILWIGLYVRLIFNKLFIRSSSDAWRTGIAWLLLTLFFEFGLGWLVSGLTFRQMIADYNILEGRLWPLVLMSILFLPVLYFNNIRKLTHSTS